MTPVDLHLVGGGILTNVRGIVKRQRQKSEAARLAMKTFLAEHNEALKINRKIALVYFLQQRNSHMRSTKSI